MKSAMWYVKQLLPLTYRSKYAGSDGQSRFCVWKMWLGNCFQIQDYAVSDS